MGLHYLPFPNSMSLRHNLILGTGKKKIFFDVEFVTFLSPTPLSSKVQPRFIWGRNQAHILVAWKF